MRELGNFVVSMLIVLLPMALVFRQPDLGTSLVYGVIWVAVLALAQTRRRYWVAIGAATPVIDFRCLGVLPGRVPATALDDLSQPGG